MKHSEIASELFSKRYYCSQAVLAAFAGGAWNDKGTGTQSRRLLRRRYVQG